MLKKFSISIIIIIGLILSIAFFMGYNQNNPKIVNKIHSGLSVKADPPIQILGDGGFASFPGFGNEAHPYLIENFIINSGAADGMWIQDTLAYFIIRNCTVTNLVNGIRLNNVSNGIIENTTLNSNGRGWYAYTSGNITITNSTLIGNSIDGIYLNRAYNMNISHTTATNNNYGIRIYDGNNCRIINNTAMYNSVQGIHLQLSNDLLIAENTASENTFSGDGIRLIEVNNSKVVNNTANNNGDDGISGWKCHHNEIINNTVQIAVTGIGFSSSTYNNITDNFVTDASNVGINLYHSNNSNVIDNEVYSSRLGIYLFTSHHNFVARNTVEFTIYNAISLYDHSSYNTIHNNTCNDNHRGIYIWEFSNYNTITWNKFNNNAVCIGEITCFGNVIQNNDCQNTTGDYIPGFEWIFVFMAIGSIIFWGKIKKR